MKRLLIYLTAAIVALILIVGMFYPDGLNWLLPEPMHYEHWPVWVKVLGWLCVAITLAMDFFSHDEKH